ncbi:MAG: hypothetical protein JXD23_07490 [Spirochaetales bacterium]|nr:hypothetical protein [Spirochaetales bacterium]
MNKRILLFIAFECTVAFLLQAQDIPDPAGCVLRYLTIGDSWDLYLGPLAAADFRDVRLFLCRNGYFQKTNGSPDDPQNLEEGTWSYHIEKGTIAFRILRRIDRINYGEYKVQASAGIWRYHERIESACDETYQWNWKAFFTDYRYLKSLISNHADRRLPDTVTVKNTLQTDFFSRPFSYIDLGMTMLDLHLENLYSVDLETMLKPKFPEKGFIRVLEDPDKAILMEVSASSNLVEPKKKDAYHPMYVIDGNPRSGWFEGVDGPGLGESVGFVFANLRNVTSIGINPGWMDRNYYSRNNRLKKIRLIINGEEKSAEIPDAMKEFRFTLSQPITISDLKIIIDEVYPTSKWDDTPVSGIQFYVGKKQVLVSPGTRFARFWKE